MYKTLCMSTFDHQWSPQWSKAIITFGYCYSERMIRQLLDQLPVNVLQGKLCASGSIIPKLLPGFQRSWWWALRGVGTRLSMCTYISAYTIILLFLFFIRMSASCTHVSALLHALGLLHSLNSQLGPPVQQAIRRRIYQSLLILANGRLLKNANRALFALAILCLKNMCMARWRKDGLNPWKILIPVLISSKAQRKIIFQLCWTTSVGRSCAFLFCLTPSYVLMMAQHCLHHPFQLQVLSLVLRSWRNQFQPSRKV